MAWLINVKLPSAGGVEAGVYINVDFTLSPVIEMLEQEGDTRIR